MNLRHRGMLTLVTLAVLVSVTLGGSLWLLYAKVDPATASRAQLLRHLVLSDISLEPQAVQQAWVDRLQQELTSDFAPGGQAKSLSPVYRERLIRNIDTLQVVWFQTRTAQYAELPAQEREEFMVNQLAVVGCWAKIASLLEAKPVPLDVATRKLVERIDGWVHQASGKQRDDMVAAVKDGTLCWLSTTDLSVQPLAVKSSLAVRLAKELDRGAKPKVGVSDTARRAQLNNNAAELVEAYIYALAGQFAELPASDRAEFIDDQLASVERWGIQDLLAGDKSSGTGASKSRTAAALALLEHSQRWVEHAPEEQRPQVQAFVTAIQQRMVWKQLPGWMRG